MNDFITSVKKAIITIITFQVCCIIAYGQTIALTGTVSDSYGNPIRGATVKLPGENLVDTTNSSGHYEIIRVVSNTIAGYMTKGTTTHLHRNVLYVSVGQRERVRIQIYDLEGKLVHAPVDRIMKRGEHSFNLPETSLSSRMLILRVISGTKITTYIYRPMGGSNQSENKGDAVLLMATKSAAAVDTLEAKAGGFQTTKVPVEKRIDTVNITLTARPTPSAVLWKEIDLTPYGSDKGFYVSVGDLDNDSRVDYLLHRVGRKTTAGYVLALDHDGKKLWDFGDPNLAQHEWWDDEPPNRAICSVYDVDNDGKSEAIIETYLNNNYRFLFMDGKTGTIKKSTVSPFAEGTFRITSSSRPHPVTMIAFMNGADKLPTIVFKWEASNKCPTMAAGYDKDLNQKWKYGPAEGSTSSSMGHVPDVADIDNDGKEELMLGYVVLKDNGTKLWQPPLSALSGDHADMVTAADILPEPGMEVLIARCHTGGLLYAFSSAGKYLWTHSQYANHTETVWAGNFIETLPGPEIIFQVSHTPCYVTVDTKGSAIKTFALNGGIGYPDWGTVVNWKNTNVQSLWIPVARKLVDGYGNTVTGLGNDDAHVVQVLNPDTVKTHTGTESFAVDVYGDEREEIVLYCREAGSNGIFIFTQSDNEGGIKPYGHQKNVYNMRTPN